MLWVAESTVRLGRSIALKTRIKKRRKGITSSILCTVTCNCFDVRWSATLAIASMRKLTFFSACCSWVLLFTSLTQGQTVPQSPQGGVLPGGPYPPGDPRSRVLTTGMAANGGSILNGVYSNSIYEFSMQIPPGWAVLPTPAARIAGSEGADAQRPEVQKELKQVILIMSENAPLKRSVERKQVQIIAMKLPTTPGPTAAEGYITYSQRMAKEKGLPVEFKGSPEKKTIHEQPFSMIQLEETTDGTRQHISQYVTTRGQDLLQFLLISPDEEGLKTLEPLIHSVQFKAAKPAKKPPTKEAATKPKSN